MIDTHVYVLKWLTWGRGGEITQSWKVPEDLSYVLSTHEELGLRSQHSTRRDRQVPGGQPAILVW